jgi:2-dehydro-3-deoxygluconokinase
VADSGGGRRTGVAAVESSATAPALTTALRSRLTPRDEADLGSRVVSAMPREIRRPCRTSTLEGDHVTDALQGAAHPLDISTGGEIDLLALGAIVTRLDTGHVPFRKAHECAIHVSGAEFNVAANLADCFGLRTAIASAMVDYPVGDLVSERVKAMGVDGIYRRFRHDGVSGPNIATVYSDRGYGVRAPVVFYNRAYEAAAQLQSGDFDWPAIFARGVRWFHTGGLFAALSDTTPSVVAEAILAARAAGAIVSYDLNFRAKLWAARGGVSRARSVTRDLAKSIDVLVGNEEDLQLSLGISGPQVARASALDPTAFATMIERVVERFPNVRLVATTLREVRSATCHRWSALVWCDGDIHQTPAVDLEVLDRVGGGDGFAAGLFYGLLHGSSLDEALRLGWAHGALVTTYPGDTTMATLADVISLATGESARIQR